MCDYLRSIGVPHAIYQPLGVDAEIFHPRRRSPHLRAHLGLREDARILVYAGRFAEEKNLPLLLHAFALLGAPYHLLLIGGKRAARPMPNVTLMPYRTDSVELARWIASADALVHAGTRETFGLVILEAMACGRPVVAVRAGAFPELVEESVGLLAEPDRPDRMAEAIAALYERDLGGRRCGRPGARVAPLHLGSELSDSARRLRQPRASRSPPDRRAPETRASTGLKARRCTGS